MIDPTDRWKRVETLCQAALKVPEPQRLAFLETQCADPEMRLEVTRLLAQESRAEHFLETPADAVAASVLNAGRASLTGTRLNGLEIGLLLGAGGMGEVYRARDTSLLRDVAVKVIRGDLANDGDTLARFSREARILATLNHPNVAQVYGLEDVGDLRLIVMELVEGPTLDLHIEHRAMATDVALGIAPDVERITRIAILPA